MSSNSVDSKKIVVLGVGNLLFSDEGIGVHVVRALEKEELPTNVEVHDGNTLGLMCVPFFLGSNKLIIVDAVDTAGEPGDVKIFDKESIMLSTFPVKLSPHQIGIQETLLVCDLRGECPEEVIFVGVIPASYDSSIELTDVGEKAKIKVVNVVKQLISGVSISDIDV